MSEQFSVLFMEIANLAIRVGAAPINSLPGCWEYQVSPEWWVAVNGHGEPKKCSRGVMVERFHAYVEFNGWPWGILNPRGGTAMHGAAANEAALSAALLATGEGG